MDYTMSLAAHFILIEKKKKKYFPKYNTSRNWCYFTVVVPIMLNSRSMSCGNIHLKKSTTLGSRKKCPALRDKEEMRTLYR